MDPIELAWAAGFFDGEGSTSRTSVTNGRSDKRYSKVVMTIPQNDRRPLDRFKAAVGVGRVSGPYVRMAGNPYFVWQGQSKLDVHEAVWALWPYLSEPKREQINLAVDNFVKH